VALGDITCRRRPPFFLNHSLPSPHTQLSPLKKLCILVPLVFVPFPCDMTFESYQAARSLPSTAALVLVQFATRGSPPISILKSSSNPFPLSGFADSIRCCQSLSSNSFVDLQLDLFFPPCWASHNAFLFLQPVAVPPLASLHSFGDRDSRYDSISSMQNSH